MIVIDATPLQTGHRFRGIGTYTAGLLEGLTQISHPSLGLLVQHYHPEDHPILADVIHRRGVRPIHLHKPYWRRDRLQWLVGGLAIKAALWQVRPRLYHALESNGLVISPTGVTIATLHDLIPLHDVAAHFPPRWIDQRLGYARYLHNLKQATHIIADSEATKNDAIERLRIDPDRISVVLLAIDKAAFYPHSVTDVEEVLRRYHLRQPYFLHVASRAGPSDNNKNTTAILRAFEAFCQEGCGDHDLYIVGKWSIEAMDDVRYQYPVLVQSERIRWLGFVPNSDLAALYSGATALVYPSLLEGFGLPVLEAMHCATPVITSRIGSLREAGGPAPLYVDPFSIDEIAGAMDAIARQPDLRARLIQRGLQQASLFSWRRTAEQTLRIYERFLS